MIYLIINLKPTDCMLRQYPVVKFRNVAARSFPDNHFKPMLTTPLPQY